MDSLISLEKEEGYHQAIRIYFGIREKSYALRIEHVYQINPLITLEELYNKYKDFKPPQSYKLINDPTELQPVLHNRKIELLW